MTFETAAFSVKSYVAAVIAYYVVLRVGFSQPQWALLTVYIVSQPLAGAVLSKALFRLFGTLLGGTAAVAFVPAFVNEPLALSFVLALWLGLCVYIARLDRTPRSYVFLLAGYTASIIGFPSVQTPGGVFNFAILRVQEIGIGIAAASCIHGFILPGTITKRLEARIRASVSDAERWSRAALAGRRDPELDRKRRRLIRDVNEIEQLLVHLPFDIARVAPRGRVIRAIQDQISWLLPLSGSVEDRIAEITEQSNGLPPEIGDLIRRVEAWLGEAPSGRDGNETARELVREAARLEATVAANGDWEWRRMLLLNLLARLADLVAAHQALRELVHHIGGERRGLSPEAEHLVAAAEGRSLHHDHGLALRSATGAVIAVFSVCAFWIASKWPSGGTAALLAGVACALFGGAPAPGVAVRRFFLGAVVGIAAAAVYGYALLPRVTDFVILVMVLAPFFLVFGALLARPPLTLFSLGGVLSFLTTVGVANVYQSDFNVFANSAIAILAGTGVSVIVIDMFSVVGSDVALARLFRAGFRDIAARAEGNARDTRRWTSRMIDRAALIAARLGSAAPGAPVYDELQGMRIGYIAGELHTLMRSLAASEERTALDEALRRIGEHYRRSDPSRRVTVGEPVLRAIDRAIIALIGSPRPDTRRSGVILLTGLRRSLFPDAHAFTGTRG